MVDRERRKRKVREKRKNILKWKKKYKQRKEAMKKGFLKIQQDLRVKYTKLYLFIIRTRLNNGIANKIIRDSQVGPHGAGLVFLKIFVIFSIQGGIISSHSDHNQNCSGIVATSSDISLLSSSMFGFDLRSKPCQH